MRANSETFCPFLGAPTTRYVRFVPPSPPPITWGFWVIKQEARNAVTVGLVLSVWARSALQLGSRYQSPPCPPGSHVSFRGGGIGNQASSRVLLHAICSGYWAAHAAPALTFVRLFYPQRRSAMQVPGFIQGQEDRRVCRIVVL